MASMDEGVATISVDLPNGTDLDTTEETTLEVLYRLQDIPEADVVYANVGSGMLSSGTNSASITMNLVDAKDRKRSTEEVCDDIEKAAGGYPRCGYYRILLRFCNGLSGICRCDDECIWLRCCNIG